MLKQEKILATNKVRRLWKFEMSSLKSNREVLYMKSKKKDGIDETMNIMKEFAIR